MRDVFKVTIFCLIVAFLWNIASTQQLSQYTSEATREKQPRDIILASGNAGTWAIVSRFNKRDPEARGYEPTHTVIFCRYKPIVQKVNDERWQITFTSEIAENIP